MNKSKIEWCDMTWNPITGCLNECNYCYARKIANRFGGRAVSSYGSVVKVNGQKIADINSPFLLSDELKVAPFPFGFMPTFHRYRLDEPAKVKKPQTVFVGSMCDMFGDWIPDEWIQAVFDACAKAPQHRYMFLTKNPERYEKLVLEDALPREYWYGSTVTDTDVTAFYGTTWYKTFWSIEPILAPFENRGKIWTDFTIIGAETGNRKDKVIPERRWIENIVNSCKEAGIPVFMKNSLAGICGEPLIQEYPWEVKE